MFVDMTIADRAKHIMQKNLTVFCVVLFQFFLFVIK